MDAATAVATVIVGCLALIGLFVVLGLAYEGFQRIRRGSDDEAMFDDEDESDSIREAAAELELEHDWWSMSLEGLEAEPRFQLAVADLSASDVEEVVALSRDADGWVASMALAALARRADVPGDWVAWATRNLVRPSVCEDRLLLRALAVHADRPVIGAALQALESVRDDVVAEFVADRLTRGEMVDEHTFDGISATTVDALEAFVSRFEPDFGAEFTASFERWRALWHLGTVGRVWERPFDEPPTVLVGRRRELVELVVSALGQSPPRSVLLVGEHGVGKTALTRAALARLEPDAVVFETTAAQLNAGAMYVGELEGRVKTLVDAVEGQNVVWIVPELQETLFAGQHSRSPQGLLDALLPHVESGRIALVAEVTPQAAELLVAARPRVKSAFEVVRVRPLDDEATIAVARHALETDVLGVSADDETLRETLELAQQFFPGVAQPGNVLRLVQATAAEAAEKGEDTFDGRDALATLAASSGLPLALLDPSAVLLLDDVRAFFSRRVLEQPEAVDCVVERIALVKAGVTDPDASARRVPLRRPDGHGQDGDRQGPRRVPLRLARAPHPPGHERIPDARILRPPPLGHRARRTRGRTRLVGAEGSVRGRAARRVREGSAAGA